MKEFGYVKVNLIWIILLVLSLLLTNGCSAISGSAPVGMRQVMVIDGVAVTATGKTIRDHIVSYTSGKNCSSIRRQLGQNFCEEDDLSPPEEIYCYNSLGNVSCYNSIQPFGQDTNTIGHISGKTGLIR